jgi:hypothetical protein
VLLGYDITRTPDVRARTARAATVMKVRSATSEAFSWSVLVDGPLLVPFWHSEISHHA